MAAQAKRRAMAEAHLSPEIADNAERLRMNAAAVETLPNPNSMEPVPVEGASKAPSPPAVLDAPPLHVSGAHVSGAPEHPTLETL
jgi:hypothetical protein